MLAHAAFPAFGLTLAGFILFLLVTLSVPIINSIYLLHITTADGGFTVANAGVFGICYPGGSESFLGFTISTVAECTSAKVGYKLNDALLGSASGLADSISKGLTGALVINAVACGFAGLSLFWAFFAWFCASRVMEVVTFLSLLLSVLFGWIAWALDIAIALVARHHINHDDTVSRYFEAHISNAVWIALAGAVCVTLALCAAGCGCFGRYSARYADAPAYGNRYPWRRGTAAGTY